MTLVFDANALIASLHGEDGGEYVQSLLSDPSHTCLVHAINLCEVYYDVRRRGGEELARGILAQMLESGLVAREDMDSDLWMAAGRVKADLKRISLADCFCAALAERVDGTVVTADVEFKPLAEAGRRVTFIR